MGYINAQLILPADPHNLIKYEQENYIQNNNFLQSEVSYANQDTHHRHQILHHNLT